MATIVTRSGKGSPLTNNEVDTNFTNLNTELGTKLNASSLAAVATSGAYADLTGKPTIASADGSVIVTGTTNIDLSVPVTAATKTVILPIRNNTGATLAKGTAVYINGALGQNPTVTKAIATGDATSAQTLGLVTADIANNTVGNVTLIGTLTNVDTSAFTDGDQLYLSPTTAGALTATKPYAPNHLVYIAVVEYAHPSLGKLFVKVQNGYEMDELHNVAAQSPANNDGLFYNTSTSLWEKKSIVTALGYTPYNAANPSGYISGITSGNVTTALGYAPVSRTGDTMTGPLVIAFSGGLPYIDLQQSGVSGGRNYRIRSGIEGVANGGFSIRDLTSSTNVFQISDSGSVIAAVDVRAPIFYDSNDTGYYIDPTSNATSMRTNGSWITNPTSTWGGEVAGKLEYHNNRWYASVNTAFVVRSTTGSEVFWAYNTGVVEAANDFRAPIFYDSNNTAYYIDSASTSQVNNVTATGYLETFSELYTRGNILSVNAASNGWNTIVDRNGGNPIVYGYNSVRAPIFYDSDNTAYYVDGAASSSLSSLLIGYNGSTLAYNDGATGKLYFGSVGGDAPTNYHITTNMENVGGNYSKLDFKWYTGQRFYTHYAYGGVRFKEITTGNTLFSVGEGDLRVRAHDSFSAPIFYDSDNTAYYLDLTSSTSLNAAGSLVASGNITLNNGANRRVRIGSATNYSYDLQTTGDDFQIIEAGVTPRLTIKYPNGFVGFGTTSPLANIHVVGSGTSTSVTPAGTQILSHAGGFDAGTFGASLNFAQQWWSGAPTSLISVGQIVGLKTAGNGNFGGGLAFFVGPSGDGSSTLLEAMRIDGNAGGAVTANVNMRAPIFYDSNNTAFYIDPNGSSRLADLTTTGRQTNAAGVKTYSVTTAGQGNNNTRYEIMRISRDSVNWSSNIPYEVTVYSAYYSAGGSTRWSITYGIGDAGTITCMDTRGATKHRVYLGAEVVVSGTISYIPVYVDIPNYYGVSIEVKYTTNEVGIFNNSGQVQFTGTYTTGTGSLYGGDIHLVPNGGNVGIGTLSPAGRFHSVSTSGFTAPPLLCTDTVSNFRVVFNTGAYAGVPANKPWLHSYDDIYIGSDANVTTRFMSGGATNLSVASSGIVTAATAFNAPIFNDSVNSAWYIDPKDGSNLGGTVQINGGTTMSGGWNRALYLASQFPVIVMNSGSVKYSGIGVDYSEAQSGMVFWVNGNSADITNGSATAALRINTNNFVQAAGSFRAPIFYDTQDTNNYVDPNSHSNIWRLTASNRSMVGSAQISMSGLDANTWYPVTIPIPVARQTTLRIENALNSNTPSWSTHPSGFSCYIEWTTNGLGWGTIGVSRRVTDWREQFTTVQIVGGITQLGNGSTEVIWLRGGANYFFSADCDVTPTVRTTLYDSLGQTVEPRSTVFNDPWATAVGKMSYGTFQATGSTSLRTAGDWRSDSGAWTGDFNGKIQYHNNSWYFQASNSWEFRRSDSANAFAVTQGGLAEAREEFRAPIFRDSTNTAYYIDPNADTGVRSAYLNGNILINPKSESYGEGIAFLMPSQGTWGGLRWKRSESDYTGAWAFGYFGNETSNDIGFHNGTNGWRLDHSFNMSVNGSVNAPIFRDSNNAAYYVDPDSTSTLYRVNANGFSASQFLCGTSNYGDQASASTWYGIGRSDIAGWTAGGMVQVAGYTGTRLRGAYAVIDIDGSFGANTIDVTANTTRFGGDVSAPIYRDSSNTAYYWNFADGAVSYINTQILGLVYYKCTFGSNVYSGAVSSPPLQVYSEDGGTAMMSFHRAGAYAVNMGLDPDNVLRIGGWSASANRFQMDMSGNLTMAGNVTAYSDARLKKDVVTVTNALDLVGKMRGVTYTRKDTGEAGVGVIAQEMLEVLPQVVQQGIGDDDTLSVAYGNIVGVLIEAIKELRTEVEMLRK